MRGSETFYFTWDDMPAPIGTPLSSNGNARIILQVNGRYGSSHYETVCYVDRSVGKELCESLNRSAFTPTYADVIERAMRLAFHNGMSAANGSEEARKAAPICNAGKDGFHWRGGIYFQRLPDGQVSIKWYAEGGRSDHVLLDVVVPPMEWASIISTASIDGETAEKYREAVAFHGAANPLAGG